MSKILVTGGLGFIGSNLVPELKLRGHEVWSCDLVNSERPNYIRADVNKFRQLERIFESHSFDYPLTFARKHRYNYTNDRREVSRCRGCS